MSLENHAVLLNDDSCSNPPLLNSNRQYFVFTSRYVYIKTLFYTKIPAVGQVVFFSNFGFFKSLLRAGFNLTIIIL